MRMKTSKKIELEKIIMYDFSNVSLHENSTNNCFGCDSCDMCDSCDHGW